MDKIHIRTLVNYNPEELHHALIKDILVVYDDGSERVVTPNEVIFSSFSWYLLDDKYPIKLLPKHMVCDIIDDKFIKSESIRILLDNVFWDMIHINNIRDTDYIRKMCSTVYSVIDDLHTFTITKLGMYVSSLNILDLVDIVDSPTLKELFKREDYTPEYIDEAIRTTNDVMFNDTKHSNNPVIKAIRSGTVNTVQALQVLGVRGYSTEVDSTIFPVPVNRGFTRGMGNMANQLMEERSAAKALYSAEGDLQSAEYSARKIQLAMMVVEKIVDVDCGNDDYIYWMLRGPEDNVGSERYGGDLPNMVGKHYITEDGEYKTLTIEDTHLHGTTIKIRSSIHCKLKNKKHICAQCFGELWRNVTPGTNIGYTSTGTMNKSNTSSILSTKHKDSNATTKMISLTKRQSMYFTVVSKMPNTYRHKARIKKQCQKLIIQPQQCIGLNDILMIDDVSVVSPRRISFIENVIMETTIGGKVNREKVSLLQRGKRAMFSHEFIHHAKEFSWTITDEGNYKFDLTNFPNRTPLFTIQHKEFNYSAHSKDITHFLEMRPDGVNKSSVPEIFLDDLFRIVNSKSNINIALLEVMVYASTITSPDDFSLGRGIDDVKIGSNVDLIVNRSLAPFYGYEYVGSKIASPSSFKSKGRVSHPMDVIIDPRSVMENQ